MIDAEFRSEERFSKLSLAYDGEIEKELVTSKVEEIIAKHAKSMTPETYTCGLSNGREVLVIEYHDDSSREAGAIFEEMICSLNITHCD